MSSGGVDESAIDFEPPYYVQYQKLEHGHKTSDPKYAEDWGEYKRFILFPSHLPDLYIPTQDSFNETVSESAEMNFASRFLRFIPPSRYFLSVPLLLLFLISSIILVIVKFQALEIDRHSGIAEITDAVGDSISPLTTFVFALFTTFGLFRPYNQKLRSWKNTDRPEWQTKNRDGVFTHWHSLHNDFLSKRGVSKGMQKAIRYTIAIYSLRPHEFHWESNSSTRGKYMLPFAVEDKTGQVDSYDKIDEYEKILNSQEYAEYLEDALALLSDEDLETYRQFNLTSSPKESAQTGINPSHKKYRGELIKKLHKRTSIISNDSIIQKWKDLLDNPRFESRTLKNGGEGELSVEEFMDFLKDGQGRCFTIIGNSGQGKTTLSLQMAIHFLNSVTSPILPLFIKARQIDGINPNGSLSLIDELLGPYYEDWKLKIGGKVLIVDGIDENINIHSQLVDRLSKTASFYQTNLLVTGRLNTRSGADFLSYELSNFSDDYLDTMIYNSSDIRENRLYLNDYLPDSIKQHPLVIFGSAERIADCDDNFAQANLTSASISSLIFERDVDESRKKHGNSKDTTSTSNLSKVISKYIASRILNEPEIVNEDSPAYVSARKWELIDDNGVNEPLLEGFFLTQSITAADQDTFARVWKNRYEHDRMSWEGLVRASLTSQNSHLKCLRPFVNGEHSINQWRSILNLAGEEWVLADESTKGDIVRRVGFEADETGRLSFQNVGGIPKDFLEEDLILDVLSFHCETWKFDYDKWVETPDGSWNTLASQILRSHGQTYVKKARILLKTIERCVYNKPWKSVSLNKDMLAESVREFGPHTLFWDLGAEIHEPHKKHQHRYLQSLTNPTDSTRVQPRSKVSWTQRFLFQSSRSSSYMFPLNPNTPKRMAAFSKIPTSLRTLLQREFEEIKELAENSNAQNSRLQNVMIFLELAINGSRFDLFAFNYSDAGTKDIHKSMAELSQSVDDEGLQLLKFIYARLRNGLRGFKDLFSSTIEPQERYKPQPYQPNHHQKYDFALSRKSISLEELKSPQDGKMMELKTLQKVKDLNTRNDWKATPPFHGALDKRLTVMSPKKSSSFGFEVVSFIMRYPSIWVNDEDHISTRYTVFQNRIYSPIPHDLIEMSYAHHCLVLDNKNNNGGNRFPWMVLPWFNGPNKKLLDIIKNFDRSTEAKNPSKYQQLTLLSNDLKKFGKVSNQRQAQEIGEQYGITNDSNVEYFGTCALRNGPDDYGHYYIHHLTGDARSDFYVTENSTDDSWRQLNQMYEEFGKDFERTVYLKFNISIEQNPANKHCIIVAENLKLVCQSCFESDRNMDLAFPTMCENCMAHHRLNSDHNFLRHVKMIYPNIKADVISRTVTLPLGQYNKPIKELKRISVKIENLSLFYSSNTTEQEHWIHEHPNCKDCKCTSGTLVKSFDKKSILCQDCIKIREDRMPSRLRPLQDNVVVTDPYYQKKILKAMNSVYVGWQERVRGIRYGIHYDEESLTKTVNIKIYCVDPGIFIGKNRVKENELLGHLEDDVEVKFIDATKNPVPQRKNAPSTYKPGVDEYFDELHGTDLLKRWAKKQGRDSRSYGGDR